MAARSKCGMRGGTTSRTLPIWIRAGLFALYQEDSHRDEHHGHGPTPGGHHAPDIRPLPRSLRRGPGRAHPRGEAADGRLAADPGPPLPAGRGDPVRRPAGRQLQAQPARRREPLLPRDRLLRRPLHGRDGRHPLAGRGLGLSARPGRRVQHGRHGRPGIGRGRLGRPLRGDRYRRHHAGHLHQLVGRPQGLLRPARRDRLHQLERPRRARMVVRTPAPRPLLPRPAPGPEHRPDHGRPARADARLEPPRADGREHPREDRSRAGSCSGAGTARSTRCSSPSTSRSSASDSPAAASSSIPSA